MALGRQEDGGVIVGESEARISGFAVFDVHVFLHSWQLLSDVGKVNKLNLDMITCINSEQVFVFDAEVFLHSWQLLSKLRKSQ